MSGDTVAVHRLRRFAKDDRGTIAVTGAIISVAPSASVSYGARIVR
jgi:hypothetical protein